MKKLGLIGISEGNGHPYSWSAIFNGYDKVVMKECPYPAIEEYLGRQSWPASRIGTAKVTGIWTQNPAESDLIARSAFIPKIYTEFQDMIGEVDAVLLARDDSENHLHFSAPFLDAGVPVFVDKPIATKLEELDSILARQIYPGQIFSGSALSFSDDFQMSPEDRERIGHISKIQAQTPKSWSKYAVHIIEPALRLLSPEDREDSWALRCELTSHGFTEHELEVNWTSGIRTVFKSMGDPTSPFRMTVEGSIGVANLEFQDTFSAFKNTLQMFLNTLDDARLSPSSSHHARVVGLIEKGLGC